MQREAASSLLFLRPQSKFRVCRSQLEWNSFSSPRKEIDFPLGEVNSEQTAKLQFDDERCTGS